MSIRVTQTKAGKRYAARVHLGGGKYKLLKPRTTRKEARADEAKWLMDRGEPDRTTAKAFAKRYLTEYEEMHKPSSYAHAKSGINEWLKTFRYKALSGITREESVEWARENRWAAPPCVTMLNAAVEEGLIERNPLKGQGRKGRGRADKAPLKVPDVERLAAAAEKTHGKGMRAFVLFTAYSGMRVGEVFALRWDDIDFKGGEIMVSRRLYKGELDLPKSNKKRRIALLPEARDALLGLGRSSEWVFTAKRGGQMTQNVLAYYWRSIEAAYGEKVTPHELRHFLAHHLYVTQGMPAYDVAKQLGHANSTLIETLYGHGDAGALERIKAAYGQSNVRHLRAVDG